MVRICQTVFFLRILTNVQFSTQSLLDIDTKNLADKSIDLRRLLQLQSTSTPFVVQTLDQNVNSYIFRQIHGSGRHLTFDHISFTVNNENIDPIVWCKKMLQKQQKMDDMYIILDIEIMTDIADLNLWLQQIFFVLWQKNILNAIVLINYIDEQLIFTYQTITTMELKVVQLLNGTVNWARNEHVYGGLSNLNVKNLIVSMEPEELRIIEPQDNDMRNIYYGVDGDLAELVRDRFVI